MSPRSTAVDGLVPFTIYKLPFIGILCIYSIEGAVERPERDFRAFRPCPDPCDREISL